MFTFEHLTSSVGDKTPLGFRVKIASIIFPPDFLQVPVEGGGTLRGKMCTRTP